MELPSKLVIVTIIMAITIPVVFAGLNEYQEYQMKLDIEMELEKVVSKINTVHSGSHTTTDTVQISFSSRFMASVDFIEIGDNILPHDKNNTGDVYSKLIRFRIKGESTQFLELDCLATNKEFNGPLLLGVGDYKLKLTHLLMNSESFVTLEII